MIVLGVAIMSHPKRAEHVRWMEGELSRLIAEARALGCHTLPPFVSVDTDSKGCWWNNRRCWQTLLHSRIKATHCLVVQDDVKFCRGFIKAVHKIIEVRPDGPVGFYMSRHAVTVAREADVRWLASKNFLSSIATLIPAPLVAEALDWIAATSATNKELLAEWSHHDDVRFNAFFKAKNIPVHVTIPNLVEHVGHQEAIGSVLNHYGAIDRRMSRWYIGDDIDASEIDWDRLDEVKEWKLK